MKYKIGEVSKILGLSADLLRYYEQKGIVAPEKDGSNGYRYYNITDINYLIDCLYYKNLGFSLDQTASLVHRDGVDTLSAELLENEMRLNGQMLHLQMLLEHSRRQRQALEQISRGGGGQYSLRTRPEMLYYTHRQDLEYLSSPEVYAVSQEWLNYLPFACRTFRIPASELDAPEGGGHFQWGFSLRAGDARLLRVSPGGPVARLPEARCIYTVLSNEGSSFSPALLRPCVRWLSEHGWRLNGPVFGSLIISAHAPAPGGGSRLVGHYEVWLPVESRENAVPGL